VSGGVRNPFRLPAEPKSGLDLLRWTLFEYPRLQAWCRKLTRRQGLVLYLRVVPWIVVLSFVVYPFGLILIEVLELPLSFPDSFEDSWVSAFTQQHDFLPRFIQLLEKTIRDSDFVVLWAMGLSGGLILGLVVVLAWDLSWGLAWGLTCGLSLGLVLGLAWGFGGVPAGGLALGLASGLTLGQAWGFGWFLAGGLALSLALGLETGLAVVGLAAGLGLLVGWLIGFFRIPFYLYQFTVTRWRVELDHNPYLWDAGVRLPIWGLRRKLATEASRDPDTGRAFAEFLLEYRPLQRDLAAETLHAATAGRWRLHPLQPEVLEPPPEVEGEPAFAVSIGWMESLSALRQELASALMQNAISLKREAFGRFSQRLDAFRALTLLESPRWSRYYLEPLSLWRSETSKELQQIEQLAQSTEPIAANVFRPGTPLRPESDKDIFFGREDLRQELSREILTAREMPLFLLLGQRRVGKTSLLYFLPALLGSGFQVVFQDLQDPAVTSMTAWMQDLCRRIAQALKRTADQWQPPKDWLQAWSEFLDWLNGATVGLERKLILALDEYETLHPYLQEDPKQGRRLLGALRSFSQHQNQVVFLFAGATPFSELREPDWSEFFVQAVRFPVGYLAKSDALRLITEPVPLDYPPELTERLYRLTQGHPALIQRLCQQLVNIANRDERRIMRIEDLDEALERAIDRETPAMERFWNEFCRTPACRDCVGQILAGEAPIDRAALFRLQEQGYIVQEQGNWRMRVPLFDEWLRKYRDTF
jgi:hypothetical protein